MDPEENTAVCEVCGAEDMIFRGSQAQCPHCGSVVNTQETTVTLDDSTQFRYLGKILNAPQGPDIEQSMKEIAIRPWKLSEAFQHILLKQITVIESALDLPMDYRQMVIKIWMLYLKVTGEAFLSESERHECRFPLGWGWIYDPDEGKELFRTEMMLTNKEGGSKPLSGNEKLEKMREELEAQEARENLEVEIEDHSSSSSSIESDESEDDQDSVEWTEPPRKTSFVQRSCAETRRYWRGWLSDGSKNCRLLEFNLAVCYIPLLYIKKGEKVFGLCDLIGVVQKHPLIYQNARASLPSWICVRDHTISHYFRRWSLTPNRTRLRMAVTRLLIFLEMKPPKLPLFSHIGDQITKLQLPVQVGQLARNICALFLNDEDSVSVSHRSSKRRRSEYGEKRTMMVTGDLTAASFVLIALVSLHGKSSNELRCCEDYVRQLRRITGRNDLFLMSEWISDGMRHMKRRQMSNGVVSMDMIRNPPPVGSLIGPDSRMDVEEVGHGATGGRAIHKHEKLRLIMKTSFVKELLAPFRPLIDRSLEIEDREVDTCDYSHYILCYPRDTEELRQELDFEEPSNTSFGSNDLFEDDEPLFEEISKLLPNEKEIGSRLRNPLPKRIPKDWENIVNFIAWKVHESPKRLWGDAVTVHECLLYYTGTRRTGSGNVMGALGRKLCFSAT